MKIKLLAFATASDIVGKGPQELTFDDGARLSDLKALLTEKHPVLESVWDRLAVAVGGTLVRDEDPELKDGDEVALLPPVSGGSPEADR